MSAVSLPFLEMFNPYVIPMQGQLLDLIEGWDYAGSTPEILLSGAYGSSKSIIAAHIAVVHCLDNPGAVVCLGRRALPDIKKTIFLEICEHLDTPGLEEGKDYTVKETTAEITFENGSKIISASWADRRYKKFRSLKISMFLMEEAAENDLQDREAFMAIKARLRRLPNVKQNILLVITNPDSPEHWLYEYFMEGEKTHDSRRVFYSVTTDNVFLDPVYVQQLKKDLSPKEVRRFIFGEWLSLLDEVIYSDYDPEENYSTEDYLVDESYPIGLTWDFNIADGKPMSALLFQYIDDHFHFFEEVIMFSARTKNTLEELEERCLLSFDTTYVVYGDAAGKNRDTRSKRSDYGIIYEYLEKLDIPYEKKVPPANPPIRKRHNIVNGYCINGLSEKRITVYKKCKTLHKGMKLTKLKQGAAYIEDDSKACPWQHCTTALGYAVLAIDKKKKRTPKYGARRL